MFSLLEESPVPQKSPQPPIPSLEKFRVKTVPALRDVISDPARNDLIGSDWTSEGGATLLGPATNLIRFDDEA